jgi:ubiquinol-cytochrome c reductase cytochrome b subunit
VRVIGAVARWIDSRLQLGAPLRDTMAHPVPRETASWAYVFGSAALTTFVLQVVTGTLLAFVYVPSAHDAWTSLQTLNHQVAFGWFIRGLHGWGSNFMIAIVLIHMVQVFLFGAYKFPRELTWVVGVLLLIVTLGMAFTGQVLRFDQDAYWGLGIGASIASRVPIVAIHVLLVLTLGVNEWPMPGRVVRRATYMQEYRDATHRAGVPFVPYAVWKDIVFSSVILLSIGACAFVFGPFGPSGPPDPRIIQTAPRPDFFFLWLYALLSLLPPSAETPILLIAPGLVIAALIALPFIAGEGEKSWRRRPIAVLTVLLVAVTLGTLTELGGAAPWSPSMNAWSGSPIPAPYLRGRTALERQGALVFQNKQCHNCHALGGGGGRRGPALDTVAVSLTRDELIRQVIQGGGNMPAYGRNLSPAETNALVAFLQTMHPDGQMPARDASRAAGE